MPGRTFHHLCISALVVAALICLSSSAYAYPNGISGMSGKSGSTCTMCHSSGTGIPSVAISGPTTVTSGATVTYTLSNNGTPNSGLDVASTAGTFTAGSTTQVMSGEITHLAALTTAPLSWSFSWTAPTVTTPTTVTLYGASISGGYGGSTGTTTLAVTVNPAATAPSITSQPANQTVTAGQTAAFSVTASGTAPLTYQWRKNGVNISGATASSYTTPATATTDSGSTFSVIVTNSAGSATSNNATLTVNAATTAPSITSQPASQTVTAGQTASFSVAANGTAPMSYQWRKNGTNISGATASSYTTPATTSTDNGTAFSVIITNSAGSATSNNAMLTVNAANVAPSITTQPGNQTVNAGQTATFSVLATGSGTLSYQWSRNGTNITGANASSYTTPATTTADSGSTFSVVVSNSAGSATSNNATLTVNSAPTSGSGGKLVLSTNRLIFYANGSTAPAPKSIQVTSTGGATNFTADVYGGSWISVNPSAGTTPGQITVSAYATGLTAGTYSCVIKISANNSTKRVYVVLVVGHGSDDDGTSTDSAVLPFSFDPGATNTAQAMWLDGHGVPYTSKKDPTNQGLVLRKNPSGPSTAIAGAALNGAAGSQLTALSFDMRSDSECSKGAPQFVVVTADEVVHKASCASGTVQQLAIPGWQRVSFNPANGAQLSPAVAPGMAVKTVALVMDHPTGTGMAVLDNINLNGKYTGRE